tara:strand:+ start:4768 stop:5436 length:669 start_codon:yes stop_codon:yes gene_type:complete
MPKNKINHYSQCAVSSCKLPMDANGEGGLDLQATGGYGDFCDDYDGDVSTFRLCHRHSHKFANWLNNPELLHPFYGHSHSGSEKGFWYGHVGWETTTWLSHIHLFLYCLIKFGLKDAIYYSKRQITSNIQWARKDINDKDSGLNWPLFISRIFFLDYHSAGFFRTRLRRIRWAYLDWLKSAYRKHTSFYTDLTNKALREGFSDTELHVIKAVADAAREVEEE